MKECEEDVTVSQRPICFSVSRANQRWPEYRFAAVDIFSCGDVLQPRLAADYLAQRFGAGRTSVVELDRGRVDRNAVKHAMSEPSVTREGPSEIQAS